MSAKIKNIVFDVGGVLADYHQYDYFNTLGYSPEMAEKLRNATQKTPDWVEYDRGVLTDEEIRARFKKRTPELADEIDKSLTHMYGLVTGRDTARPWITSLKERGLKTYVLSNFSKTCYEECRKALSFESLMDGCLWSFQQHVVKPDDVIFLLLLHMFHLRPEETIFIDDTLANATAASAFGIHGIVFTDQAETEQKVLKLVEGKQEAHS